MLYSKIFGYLDLVDYVEAREDAAKDDVLAVKVRRAQNRNEELPLLNS